MWSFTALQSFIKHRGGQIGASLCNKNELDVVKDFIIESQKSTTKIVLPIDCIVSDNIASKTNIKCCNIMSIPNNYMGVDIGKETIQLFRKFITNSKLILWNGPMGIFETKEFYKMTISTMRLWPGVSIFIVLSSVY